MKLSWWINTLKSSVNLINHDDGGTAGVWSVRSLLCFDAAVHLRGLVYKKPVTGREELADGYSLQLIEKFFLQSCPHEWMISPL